MQKAVTIKEKQMLAEALTTAFEIARKLGIEFRDNQFVDVNKKVISKPKPELKKEKIERYSYLLATGKKQTKAEILKNIT